MPSGGLIDNPQDAKMYHWHLLDPRDKPFANFKFHYRSWKSLEDLQLVPEGHPHELIFPSPSILSLNGLSRKDTEVEEEEEERLQKATLERRERDAAIRKGAPDSLGLELLDQEDEETLSTCGPVRDSVSSENSATPWLTNVFDESPEESSELQERRAAFRVPRSGSPYPGKGPDSPCKINSHTKLQFFPMRALECGSFLESQQIEEQMGHRS